MSVYHASQYEPPNELLRWWEKRRIWYPIADDVRSIHWTCRLFFELFDPDLVVYVHGSFASRVQTDWSDVNLYIPSHSRKEFEQAWSRSPLRKPKQNDPNVGVSVNELLEDVLGREVTICFHDDGCSWVGRDTKVEIFPSFSERCPGPAGNVRYRRPYLLGVLRKCWYKIQQLHIGETEKDTPRAEMFDNAERMSSLSELSPKISLPNLRVMSVIFDICELLVHSVQKAEWTEWLPEYCQTILSLVDRFDKLEDQVNDPVVDDDTSWSPIVGRFEELAADFCSFEDELLPV